MNPLNQYSFIVIAGLVLLGLGGAFWFTGFTRRKALALALVTAAFIAVWSGLRTGASAYQQPAQAQIVIREAQRPVLVEFYSDYCAGCLAAKPTLDSLEAELANELTVIRLDVASPAGEDLRGTLKLYATPTFILFDAQGNEIWRRVGTLDPGEVREAVGKS
jgi:thiol-disulfide isomerase/thioredoxin